jgi:hypothetical protein
MNIDQLNDTVDERLCNGGLAKERFELRLPRFTRITLSHSSVELGYGPCGLDEGPRSDDDYRRAANPSAGRPRLLLQLHLVNLHTVALRGVWKGCTAVRYSLVMANFLRARIRGTCPANLHCRRSWAHLHTAQCPVRHAIDLPSRSAGLVAGAL